jgi:hypothetical protein
VPNGYIASNNPCTLSTISALSVVGTSCTITNTLDQGGFTVDKNFLDPTPPGPSSLPVSISLVCPGATVTNSPQIATHINNAVFNVTGPQTGSCTATEAPIRTTVDGGTCTATLAVGVCTITNTPKQVTFTVIKDFQPNDAQTPVSVTLVCNALAPNGYIVGTNPAVIVGDGQASWDVYAWPVGDPDCHAVENPVPAGYASSGQCDYPSTTANSCTIVNQKLGKVIVNKVTTPAGDLTSFPITLSGPTGGPGSVTDATNFTFDNLQSGLYNLTEQTPAGWQFTGGTCDDGSLLNAIAVDLQDVITCTLNNTKLGTIIVAKLTTPSGAATQFPVEVNDVAAGFITDATDLTLMNLQPGSYKLEEILPSSIWEQLILCSAAMVTSAWTSPPPRPRPLRSMAAGQIVTCVRQPTDADYGAQGL